ncbi:PQQ-binding-like beta-propeller repeat protein [bacterium]|nr:PQQ-binding-like beta-propeller repeat protein [bacterium]
MRFTLCCPALLLAILLSACGSSGQLSSEIPQTSQTPAAALAEQAFPADLPADALQPWEHATAAISPQSALLPGVERFSDSASGVSDNGEALHLQSSTAPAWAIYRIPSGTGQPGVLSVDANLLPDSESGQSAYYVAFADYSSGRWQWQGPFTDSHVRLGLPSGGTLSTVNSFFAAVLVSSGDAADIVAIGLEMATPGDTEAPPGVSGLSASAVAGGAELQWNPVLAGDLAGYRIYWSTAGFINPHSVGVQALPYLEGASRHLLDGLSRRSFIRITAVDTTGNEGPVSELLSVTPLPGSAPLLTVTTDAVSGLRDDLVTITASGAESYDFDLDGDGIFDSTGNATGSFPVDTSHTGIIRPRVRASSSSGNAVALGSVSLFISGNSRPVALAIADPQSGPAPLAVSFTGLGEDNEDSEGDLTYAWDFDGDGFFEADTDTREPDPQTYSIPGTFNAKFRVTDSQGAWDVDTVAINVGPLPNQLPVISLQVSDLSGDAPLDVGFSAFGTVDPDGQIVEYAWDFDGDGLFDAFSDSILASHTFTEAGVFNARLRVEDNDGGRAQEIVEITVNNPANPAPVAVLESDLFATIPGQQISFDASGSTDDGSIEKYEWDFDGDGNWDSSGSSSTAVHAYTVQASYRVRLRVTDDGGNTDTTDLVVSHGYSPIPRLGFDNRNTGQSPFQGPLTNNLYWDTTNLSQIDDSQVIVNQSGHLFTTDISGSLYSLRPTDGTEIFSDDYGGLILSTPALGADGSICFTNLSGNLICLNPDGSIRWPFGTAGQVSSSPLIGPDGAIYFGSHDGNFYAVEPDGTQRWAFPATDQVNSSPAMSPEGTLYVGCMDGFLYAINPDGSQQWAFDTDGQINRSSPAIAADGTIYIVSANLQLHAVTPQGTKLWGATIGSSDSSPAIARDGTVYIGADDGKLRAINPLDGSELWSFQAGGPVTGGICIGVDGNIYFGSNDNFLYALDKDGNLLFSYETGSNITSSPSIGIDGSLYVPSLGGFNGELVALRDAIL